MITKKQWNELCDKIRLKRAEGKIIKISTDGIRTIEACYQASNVILLNDETKLTLKSFPRQSYQTVKSKFFWIELHDFNE